MKVNDILNEEALEDVERGDMDNPLPFDRAKAWKMAEQGDEIEGGLIAILKKELGIDEFTSDDYGSSYKAANEAMRKRYGTIMNVPINKIVAGEPGLYKAQVDAIMKGDNAAKSSEFPIFYKIGNEYYAADGNHRIAAAFLQGHKEIQGLVMDLDKLSKQLKNIKT